MTAGEWQKDAARRLTEAGCEDGRFDALCLLEDIAGLGRRRVTGKEPLSRSALEALEAALAQRLDGRPLQYILGEWDFLDLTLSVGEGVLIPRQDTELLCRVAADRLRGVPGPRVLDLCAGTGCVGLGVASLCPSAQVTEVELSPEAFAFLEKNIARYPALSVEAKQGDVLTDAGRFGTDYDAILSNPPYIPTGDLDGLQREVKREPTMALDGADDGLAFYRVIAGEWCSHLKIGGFCAVEVGFGQAPAVEELFRRAGLKVLPTAVDLGGIPRVVCGVCEKK